MSEHCPYCEQGYTDYFRPKYKKKESWDNSKEIEVLICTRCSHITIWGAKTLELE